jgi:flagellin-like hook-associated protein FlgL
MVDSISTLGLQMINAANLTAGQATMAKLTQQLATGKVATNLSDYSDIQAQNLVSLTNSITQQQGFQAVATTITPRLTVYDQALTGIENVAEEAGSAVESSTVYNSTQNSSLATQIQGYLSQVGYYLNQQVDGRYIFAGSRYTTAPVGDLTTLPTLQDNANASATVQTDCLTLTSQYSGTSGNGISMTLSAGTNANTYKATISIPGQSDEVFDNIGGTGVTFWNNLAAAINTGSRLVTATAGTDATSPILGTSTQLTGGLGASANNVASASVSATGMTFSALNAGTYGNNISVSISDGTNTNPPADPTFKVTVHIPGQTDEVYDDIDASGGGASFWSNVADAINEGQASAVPPTAASQLIEATTGTDTTLPTVGTTTVYDLTGGAQAQETSPTITADIAPSATVSSYNASATLQANCLTLTSNYSGTFGNNISVSLSAGTNSTQANPTYKATISIPGQADEIYDDIGGTGATFWSNLASAINAGSRLVTATAGTGMSTPVTGITTTLTGGAGLNANNVASASTLTDGTGMTFTALNTGTLGNGVSVTISDGTNTNPPVDPTYKVTVSVPGQADEVYDDIDGSGGGAAFWSNVANAINQGQPGGAPPTSPSQYIMATAGAETMLPTPGTTATYDLTGGTNVPITPPATSTTDVLPIYDSEYDASYDPLSGQPDPNVNRTDAYAQDQISIDTTQTLKYGVTSNETGFQQLILGLRYAYAATQDTTTGHTNYTNYMNQANTLISEGLDAIRGIHTGVSNANATLTQTQSLQTTDITNLQNQVGDIQNVDVNSVAVQITTFQAELEAAYAATAKMTEMSLLQYLGNG